jgi:hypothetical protein
VPPLLLLPLLLPLDEPLLPEASAVLPPLDPLLLVPPSPATHTFETQKRPLLQSAVWAQDWPMSLDMVGPLVLLPVQAAGKARPRSTAQTVIVHVDFTSEPPGLIPTRLGTLGGTSLPPP